MSVIYGSMLISVNFSSSVFSSVISDLIFDGCNGYFVMLSVIWGIWYFVNDNQFVIKVIIIDYELIMMIEDGFFSIMVFYNCQFDY